MMSLLLRDMKLAFRVGGGALTGILFFLVVVTIVPFAVGPDLNLLSKIGPAILWIAALLASLLGLDRLFQQDREDGTLDVIIIQPHSLTAIVFIKCFAHWLANGLPLILATPIFGLFMNMEPLAIGAVLATLIVGTPAITFIGAVGAAVTVSLPRGGLLLAVLILPLVIPVLIFGVSATYGAIQDPAPFTSPFLILCALTLFFSVLGPVTAGWMLAQSTD